MAEKLEIQIIEAGGGGGGSGSPGPSPTGGTGPAPGGGPGPAPDFFLLPEHEVKSGGGVADKMVDALGIAELGPVGAAFAGATAGIVFDLKALGTAIRATTTIASINPDAAVNGIGKLVNTIPIFGDALGGIVHAAHALGNQLDATSRRYAQVNGMLAHAVAMSDVAQLQGDMRRAQLLGPDLSEFMQSKSNASQSIQDAMASVLKGLMPLINKGMKLVEDMADSTARVAVIAENIDKLDLSLAGLNRLGEQVRDLMKKDKAKGDDALKDIYELRTGKKRPFMQQRENEGPRDPARAAIGGGMQMRPFGGF